MISHFLSRNQMTTTTSAFSMALLLPALVALAAAAPADRSAAFNRAAENGERVWVAAQDPGKHNPRSSEFFSYALALCESKRNPERLEKLFALAWQMQDRVPGSPSYGSFRWNWSDNKVIDANAIEFCMQPAAIVWLKHRAALATAARDRLREILGPAVEASLRHRVADSYTNIALMSAGNLIVLGEGLSRPEVADEGYARLQAIFELTAKRGVAEYLSPNYYGVDLNALQLMDTFIQRPSGQRQARALLEYFWTEIAANYWWSNQRVSGPHSRDYDYLHSQGGLEGHLAAAGFLQDKTEPGLIPSLARWQPSAELLAMSRTKLPRLVRRQWGWTARQSVTPTVASAAEGTRSDGNNWASYTHWLAKDVTLGISGANYGPIDVPLTVDFAGSRDDVRGFFLPDGRHDPYGMVKIPWRGHPKAVHLQPFFAGVQQTQDALALAVYREADVPAETKTLETHFVLPREVDAIYVGERPVRFAPGAPQSIALAAGEAVFLRKGTAAVALRVPSARTLSGEDAPVALVWDDNEWQAIRLTVDHRRDDRPAKVNAAAAFQVRVDSELSDIAFAAFRRSFTAAKCEVSCAAERISLRAPAVENGKSLAIAAAAPWTKPLGLEPAPSPALLEINGEDVGAALLQGAR